ncbi:hypothetical protein ILYODFUR_031047 [Ilyodon furcidens]|uniref:Uncharacterized protein n=1 Tax=Ilyodon furcidens TaxID=33524 RepID=A0ABV0TCS1_9TELE
MDTLPRTHIPRNIHASTPVSPCTPVFIFMRLFREFLRVSSAIEETLRGLSVATNLVSLPQNAEPREADTPPPSPPPSPLVPPALLLRPQPGDSLLIKTGYTGPGPGPVCCSVPLPRQFEAAESGTSLCRSLSDSCRLSFSLSPSLFPPSRLSLFPTVRQTR